MALCRLMVKLHLITAMQGRIEVEGTRGSVGMSRGTGGRESGREGEGGGERGGGGGISLCFLFLFALSLPSTVSLGSLSAGLKERSGLRHKGTEREYI